PGMDGHRVMNYVRSLGIETSVIVMSGHASVESAIEALRSGAYDYLRKPFEHEELLKTVENALKQERLKNKRKQAEEALRESEEKYRTVLEASPDPIVTYDMEGTVVYLNPAFTQLFGWTPEKLLGKKIDNVPEENLPETQMMIDKVMAGESFSGIKSRRYTKQREILDVSISVATYLDRDGIPVGSVHTLRDITERKRLEVQLRQVTKMEAIGTLAGGIAHDFNNLLMGIQGNVSLILMGTDSSYQYHSRLKNIEKQVQSGARLTSHLLGYARQGRYEVKSLDLNKLLEETSETFGRTRKDITIYRELAEDLFAIEADQVQIEQVLLNLFANASDAMRGGGDLILRTMNTTHNNMKGKLYDPKPGDYVLFTVTDTGIGMDRKTMESKKQKGLYLVGEVIDV
ncbi:MAG TPA: PAS domain S-box protein, partial [Desulfobacterales bacterium]|nr:PAS domain S-box protein [Desulfobacterales bacterium]